MRSESRAAASTPNPWSRPPSRVERTATPSFSRDQDSFRRRKAVSARGVGCGSVEPKYLATACLPSGVGRHWKEDCFDRLLDQKISLSARGCRADVHSRRYVDGPETFVPVFEAAVSLEVEGDDNGIVTVPSNTWLVLMASEEDFRGHPACTNQMVYLTPDIDNRLWLSEEAGIGCIISNGRSRLLRQVARNRLSLKGAEANLRKAARGGSLVALNHAELILRLVGIPAAAAEDKHLLAVQGKMRDIDDFQIREMPKADDLVEFARRSFDTVAKEGAAQNLRLWVAQDTGRAKDFLGIVARSTRAGSRRRKETQKSQTLKTKDRKSKWIEEVSFPEMPASFKACSRRSRLVKGFYALQDLIQFSVMRFGNPVRLWFHLDLQESMQLGERQFLRGCERICFYGNLNSLWRFVDSDKSGNVSLLELHPQSAMLLASFKHVINKQFDGTAKAMFAFLDDNASNRVTKGEFLESMSRLIFDGSASALFYLLDRRGWGFLSLEDITFLDKWQPPSYIFAQSDYAGLEVLKRYLEDTQGNALRAWRKVLDRDGTMKVSWDTWCKICAEIAKKGNLSILGNVDSVGAIWRAMDQDCSGWIALREWDEKSFEVLSVFKLWVDNNHGCVLRAFRAIDDSANAKVSLNELKKAGKSSKEMKEIDHEFLFEGLDVHQAGLLTENEVKFLDDWDLDWEDWQTEANMAAQEKNQLLEQRQAIKKSTTQRFNAQENEPVSPRSMQMSRQLSPRSM